MYLKIRAGLLDPKHVARMGGSPLTLYLWLHTRVKFKGDGAGCTFGQQPYRHEAAAAALGVAVGTIRDWFRTLVRGGYVTSARAQHGLTVTLTKYDEGAENPTPSPAQSVENPTPRVLKIQHSAVENPTPRNAPTRSVREKLNTQEIQESLHLSLTGEDAPATRDAPRAVPKPNRYGEVIDAITARGLEYETHPRDAKAVRESTAAPALIAEVYEALARRQWGRPFNWEQLSVHHAIACLNAYRATKGQPARRGVPAAGTSVAARNLARLQAEGLVDEYGNFLDGDPGAAAGWDRRATVGADLDALPGRLPGQLPGRYLPAVAEGPVDADGAEPPVDHGGGVGGRWLPDHVAAQGRLLA